MKDVLAIHVPDATIFTVSFVVLSSITKLAPLVKTSAIISVMKKRKKMRCCVSLVVAKIFGLSGHVL